MLSRVAKAQENLASTPHDDDTICWPRVVAKKAQENLVVASAPHHDAAHGTNGDSTMIIDDDGNNYKSLIESRLEATIQKRRENGSLRSILPLSSYCDSGCNTTTSSKDGDGLIDFSSNDYLGLAQSTSQLQRVESAFQHYLQGEIGIGGGGGGGGIIVNKNKLGSTGSRLLSGNTSLPRSIEQMLAKIHNSEDALLCNSGYDANLSLLSSIPIRRTNDGDGDVILMDELVHNSLVMGVKLSRVVSATNHNNNGQKQNGNNEDNEDVIMFRHNDVQDLRKHLIRLTNNDNNNNCQRTTTTTPRGKEGRFQYNNNTNGAILIVVESVYSMDGDIAPLQSILDTAHEFNASVIVDEAHGLGVYGRTNVSDMILPEEKMEDPRRLMTREGNPRTIQNITQCGRSRVGGVGGTGVLAAWNLQNHPALLAAVYTFGKAAGCHGAVITTSKTVVEYLVNYARPFVYSTSLPPHSLLTIKCAYETMTRMDEMSAYEGVSGSSSIVDCDDASGERRRRKVFELVKLFRLRFLSSLQTRQELMNKTKRDNNSDNDDNNIYNPSQVLLPSPSPIQAVIVRGNEQCIKLAQDLRRNGPFDVYPIRSPTVPKGEERIRIILHYHNSREEVVKLVDYLLNVLFPIGDNEGMMMGGMRGGDSVTRSRL